MFFRFIIAVLCFFAFLGRAQLNIDTSKVIFDTTSVEINETSKTSITKGVTCQYPATAIPHSEMIRSTFSKKRTIAVSSSIGAVWAGSIIGLSQIWYDDKNKTSWHVFDDSREWLQMDKVGHFYTANKISNLTYDLYRWSGLKNKTASLIGFGVGFGYQLTFECLDAVGKKWGFSWSDVGANTLGSSMFLAQQLAWKEQRLLVKFSYSPSPYAKYRPQVLGETFSERLLKDYNGQTYWLSVSPGSFLKSSKFPEWLCFSLGYSVDAKLHGDKNVYSTIYDGSSMTFTAQRQFLLSLDIDFSKIPVKKKWLRAILKQFNYLKIPFPTLILTGNKWGGSWLYF